MEKPKRTSWPTQYFVLFDYFPLLLYFLASLIKFIPWLKFLYIQEAGRGHEGYVLGRLLSYRGSQCKVSAKGNIWEPLVWHVCGFHVSLIDSCCIQGIV